MSYPRIFKHVLIHNIIFIILYFHWITDIFMWRHTIMENNRFLLYVMHIDYYHK